MGTTEKSTVHVRAISSPTVVTIYPPRGAGDGDISPLSHCAASQRSNYLKSTVYRERAQRCDQSKTIEGNSSRMWSFWMPSWLQSWLSYLGLFNKRGRLAFLGLDNAGKTSLVQMLSTGVIHQNAPT